jgi:hypothetical protein
MSDDLTTAMSKFSAAMSRLRDIDLRPLRMFTTATLTMRRERWGGMKDDARAFPDEWMSTVCAGMLCSVMPCPSQAHRLECHHSCHGGA